MKESEIYIQLQKVIEQLDIRFFEQNFRSAGVPVRSGLCKIHGENCFFMDKNLKIKEKNTILSRCILKFPVDEIYLTPKVRDYIDKKKDKVK